MDALLVENRAYQALLEKFHESNREKLRALTGAELYCAYRLMTQKRVYGFALGIKARFVAWLQGRGNPVTMEQWEAIGRLWTEGFIAFLEQYPAMPDAESVDKLKARFRGEGGAA